VAAVTEQTQSSQEPFTVDTDKLTPAIEQLNDLADQLKTAGRELESGSQELGEPWGHQETGEKFYEQYGDTHNSLIEAASQGGDGLDTAADQVQQLVAAFEKTDQQATEAAKQLGSAMEPGGS
jgi:uncharacterized protein YukE